MPPVRIGVVNPNTTRAMTDLIASCARAVPVQAEIVAFTSRMGPASIESHYDEALAVPGVLDAIARDEASGDPVDGWVLACFGDPGLDAAREAASGPVVGIAEAAMHAASLIGRTFAVVTTVSRAEPGIRELARRYGFADRCVSVGSVGIPVLDLDRPGSDARTAVIEACRRAVLFEGADSVVLGCAGMADLAAEASAEIGAPVVDGVAAGVALVSSLVALGLTTSRRDEYARPGAKAYTGLLSDFAPGEGAAVR